MTLPVESAVSLDAICAPLLAYVVRQRWFGQLTQTPDGLSIHDSATLYTDPTVIFVVAKVEYTGRNPSFFSVPLGVRDPAPDETGEERYVITSTPDGRIVTDAVADPCCGAGIWFALRERRSIATQRGMLDCICDTDLSGLLDLQTLDAEQTNSAMVNGDKHFLKWIRRVEPGPSIELEMAGALEACGFTNTSELVGGIQYTPKGELPTHVAFIETFLRDAVAGWALALQSLRSLFVRHTDSSFDEHASRLGAVVGAMHLALADPRVPTELAAHPLSRAQLQESADTMNAELESLLDCQRPELERLNVQRAAIARVFAAVGSVLDGGIAIRQHGDLHLGQVCHVDDDWVVIDFEGEPGRTHAARRTMHSPLRDVAAMLRSFDYAAAVALGDFTIEIAADTSVAAELAARWSTQCRDAFLAAYLDTTKAILPSHADTTTLLKAFQLQKALYEVRYEMDHRPTWVDIPLSFLEQAVL